MNALAIAKAVELEFPTFRDEVEDAQKKVVPIPPCSEEYRDDAEYGPFGDEPRVMYPAPDPHIYRIRPRRVRKSDLKPGKERTELVVTGRSLCPDPEPIVLVKRLSDGATWELGTNLFGTFRCSRLRAVLTPRDGDGGEIAAGFYNVIVRNNFKPIERVREPGEADFEVVARGG
jgi:hypothetical protein